MLKKVTEYIRRPTRASEIIRFLIVGGAATVVDFAVMGLVLYLFEPSLYPDFFSLFFPARDASLSAKLFGTGLGFLSGLAVNYLLSVAFVYKEKGISKTVKGFLAFSGLSLVGLLIHEFGMYLLSDKLFINEWITKIVLTLTVLTYNYLTRKAFIFKNKKGVN